MTLRRSFENEFNILPARWRILLETMREKLENAEAIVKEACVLHTFLVMGHAENEDCSCPLWYAETETASGERLQGLWRELLEQPSLQLARSQARNFVHMARYVRKIYRPYFSSASGSVRWQSAVLHH